MGSPSNIPCANPDGQISNLGAFMDGLLVVKGVLIQGSGNPVVFGSLYGEQGFTGLGTMTAYYNTKIKDRFPDLGLEVILQMAADAVFAKDRGKTAA